MFVKKKGMFGQMYVYRVYRMYEQLCSKEGLLKLQKYLFFYIYVLILVVCFRNLVVKIMGKIGYL